MAAPIARTDTSNPFHGLGDGDLAFTDRAFTRAAGAPLVTGNAVRLLRDATENYPAWLDAIEHAERWIHFECYIIHDDDAGEQFAEALMRRARDGVRVRLLYDWMGALGKTRRSFWRRLGAAGVEVRCFNPPRLIRPFDWLHRDHRKMLGVDGRVGFVTGLCIGRAWVGDPQRGIPPWRDTGVEIRGPAVADVEWAFRRVWKAAGGHVPHEHRPRRNEMKREGDVALRIVASEPWNAGLMRLDQIIASAARERLWLADAYFAGIPSYMQALRAAALDGVDVRLLVPGGSDIPLLRALSRAGYRPLLEAGVRVFEWKGPMMHAKTAVADGAWARVGSTNLNIASWLGNYELDASIEDRGFGALMEDAYLEDLTNATEIVLDRSRTRAIGGGRRDPTPDARLQRRQRRAPIGSGAGSTQRVTAGALRLGSAVSSVITDQRPLGRAERPIAIGAALVFLVVSVVAFLWPRVLAWPIGAALAWLVLALVWQMLRAASAHDSRDSRSLPQPSRAPDGSVGAGHLQGATGSPSGSLPPDDRGSVES